MKECTCSKHYEMNRYHKQDCASIPRTVDEHMIHRTKDLFDGSCVHCQKIAKDKQSHWADFDELDNDEWDY